MGIVTPGRVYNRRQVGLRARWTRRFWVGIRPSNPKPSIRRRFRFVTKQWAGQADSVHVVAGLKWLVLFVIIAALAGAATWEYQRWFALPTPGSLTIQTTTPGLK